MNLCSSTRRSLLLAGTIGSLVVVWPLAAQQPPAPTAPAPTAEAPPPWAQGRPAQEGAAMKLAPVTPPPIPTAADQLPTSKLTLPRGFKRDWLSEDAPQDKLNRMTKLGEHFGFPFCHQGNLADPEFGWGRSCDEFTKPALLLGPHSAPLGLRFYNGKMFPASYRDAIILARHGSWNRSNKIGGDVVVVRLNKDGTIKPNEDGSLFERLISGFLVNNNYIGRPTDIEVMNDGSLLISDDFNGAVYRLTY